MNHSSRGTLQIEVARKPYEPQLVAPLSCFSFHSIGLAFMQNLHTKRQQKKILRKTTQKSTLRNTLLTRSSKNSTSEVLKTTIDDAFSLEN